MKVVQINAVCGKGSTGKICVDISKLLTEQNIENYILFCSGETNYTLGVKCASNRYIRLQSLKSRIFGNYGFNSKLSTKKIISELERINPDIVHLHNIHGHDCNIKMLFDYLKSKKIKLYWTFHDCWTFTGYCTYFTMSKCEKWKTECKSCPQKNQVSFILDRSNELFNKKRKLFSGLDLTIITPSQWLADLVKQSFLKDYPVKVINNGIDLSVFKPTNSDFRKKYGIEDKFILLGVAFGWGKIKGLDVFCELAKRLDNNKYQIVLVGTNEETDKQLPNNIISIHRTHNQTELAEIYSSADLFVNPTRQDNYPTVNMEAIACGTPVLTSNTGGSPEIPDSTCGSVVECDDIGSLETEIIRIGTDKPYSKDNCIKKAETFDAGLKFKEYIELYNGI